MSRMPLFHHSSLFKNTLPWLEKRNSEYYSIKLHMRSDAVQTFCQRTGIITVEKGTEKYVSTVVEFHRNN